MSREHYPKQLLSLAGADTLLQSTAARCDGFAADSVVTEPPIVVCNEEYRFLIAEQLREIGLAAAEILLEPFGRNTAPALTLAALHATANGEDAVLLVMPSDHVIDDTASFHQSVRNGIAAALEGKIVTFGIVPARPETGYGYIHAGGSAEETVRPIKQFVEKPDRETAERYLESGSYFWNSGIFMMRAQTWLNAIQKHQPALVSACRTAYQTGSKDLDFYRIDRAAFAACPSDSIDYAVMEKLDAPGGEGISGVMVPLAAGWSDVGAWDAVWDISPKDQHGNAIIGDAVLDTTRNSLIYATSRLVACVGLEDVVVVETSDAVLVARKDRVQDVKSIVHALKRASRTEGAAHRKVHRPWGWYDGVDVGERFQVKRILVKPGAVLSLQMHHHRAEHWIIVKGTAKITRGDETFLLGENQSTYIPLGVRHRLENPGIVPLEMIEVQSGSYLGEDDIVRFEDVYGRNKVNP
jgi:mannose-1-phosphate guanylyltransferase/mannose-6-phosphate isomerase